MLLLGPVVFQDFELPGWVRFGGAQRLAVHQMPGGARVIDMLGRDDAEICWSGVFSGSDAPERARLIDLMRADLTLMLALMMPEFSTSSAFDAEISASTRPLKIRSSSLRSLPLMTIVGPMAVVVDVPSGLPFSPLPISRPPSRCCL